MRRFLTIFVAVLFLALPALATNWYIKPAYKGGSNDSLGTSEAKAWATLQKLASTTFAAGDTIIISGGIYDNQYWAPADSLKGTSMAAMIVIKAHGDSIAVFRTNGTAGNRAVFDFSNGEDFIKIDAIGKHHYAATGDSLMFKFIYSTATATSPAAIIFEGDESVPTSRAKGNRIIGVDVNGYNTAMGRDYSTALSNGIRLRKADSTDVTSCRIQYCGLPEGNAGHTAYEGFGVDANGRFNIISKCTIKYCGEAAVAVRDWCLTLSTDGSCTTALGAPLYNQVKNCVLENHWGGGIYFEDGARYNLAQDNLITYCGEAVNAYYMPTGIKLAGPRNSIRRNVIWNTYGYGIVMRSVQEPLGYFNQIADSNLVYNNVLFKNGLGANLLISVVNREETGYSANSSVKGNSFFNNVFYKAAGSIKGMDPVEIFFDLAYTDSAGNWVTPEVFTSTPATTHWNNNSFHFNDFYSDYAYPFGYLRYKLFGGQYTIYSLAQLAAADTIWSLNYSVDPEFVSTRPDTTSAPANWYTYLITSDLIEAGKTRGDPIGALATALNAGRDWADIWKTGSYHDVGMEFLSPSPAVCVLSATTFYLSTTVGDTISDTLQVFNTAGAGADTIELTVTVPSFMEDHLTITGGAGTVLPGGTANVIFKFIPAYSVNIGIIEKAISSSYAGLNPICETIDLGILGSDLTACCDVYPASTIDFGMKGVGVYYYDTLYVGNCSDTTMTISPSLAVGTAYSIIAGDSLSEIDSGDYNTLIIRFKPMTYTTYPDTLTLSNATCGTVIITGHGSTGGYVRPDEE